MHADKVLMKLKALWPTEDLVTGKLTRIEEQGCMGEIYRSGTMQRTAEEDRMGSGRRDT